MAACDIVVVGSYPPMPGPGTAATLGAVRRAWSRGATVAMVSYRTGAAPVAVPVTGPLAGWRLEHVRRHFGEPAEVYVGVQKAVPFSDRRLWARWATAAGLMVAFRRWGHVTVVLGDDPQVGGVCLRLMAKGGARFSTPDEALANRLVKRYRLATACVAFEPVAPFPAGNGTPADGALPDHGLFAPGSADALSYVELPPTSSAQRARSRLERALPGPARRLFRHR